MSKGRPILATRCDQSLVDELDEQIESLFIHSHRSKTLEWHRAEFLRAAIREKLDKMKRSRGAKKKGRTQASVGPAPSERKDGSVREDGTPSNVNPDQDATVRDNSWKKDLENETAIA